MGTPKTPGKTPWRIGLQGHLGGMFAAFVLLTGLILAGIGYRVVVVTNNLDVRDKVDDLTRIIKSELVHSIRQPVLPILSVLTRSPLHDCRTLEERLRFLPVLTTLLDNYLIVSGIMVGYENGDFFMVRHLGVKQERQAYDAPPETAFLVSSITRKSEGSRHEHLFYTHDRKLLLRRPAKREKRFDPRFCPWFRAALRSESYTETSQFLFYSRLPVIIFSEKSYDGRNVVGMDITVRQLSDTLRRELPTPHSHLALLRADGTLLASTGAMLTGDEDDVRMRTVEDLPPILRRAAHAYLRGERGRGISFDGKERNWEVSLEEFDFNGKAQYAMALAIPEDDLLSEGMEFLRYSVLAMVGIFIVCLPIIWFASRRIARPLASLAEKAGNLRKFVLDEKSAIRSDISEIHALARSMRHLQGSIRKMLTITQAISSERDFDALLQRVLKEILSLVQADGGMVALLDEEKKVLLDQGSVCWLLDGEKMTSSSLAELRETNVTPDSYKALSQNATLVTSISRKDRRSRMSHLAPGFIDPEVTKIDAVCVPLHDRMHEHIGVLVVCKAMKPGRAGFRMDEVSFIESFAATAAIALENQRLIKGQTELRDALIHIIAGAIDAKSPYTGGHCERVPAIFQMLLEAACEEREGPFKEFSLNESGWEEAKLAGWLHDCGKVTTPEYVMDKATKLETINDRIHEIRTRFEVLKRDAEIAALRATLNGNDPERETQELEKEWSALDEDFAFVAACNAGGEHMDEAALERLAAIGKRTWVRTLDKRLGVSRDERARMDRTSVPPAPAQEALLMDNPEHIIERGEKDALAPDNPWGFKVTPPRALYNRGELYNLSIRRGTLTEEERYKINDHITRTIVMLEALPLPKHLRGVPEIAGAHHETMDGRGYPRGLKREQMSWGARMMAVADIFEALTAWDRPYKESKTLRESLDIMEGFRRRKHIDPDVYALFIKTDIPRRYAAKYLKPEQNDLGSRPYGEIRPSGPENLHIWPNQGVARDKVFL